MPKYVVGLKIEAGKYYRDINGTKHGPMVDYGSSDGYPWAVEEEDFAWWDENGKPEKETNAIELVAEWSDGPTRTVTRREVVEGQYGLVTVDEDGVVSISSTISGGATADQLLAAAAVLTEIAEAVRG